MSLKSSSQFTCMTAPNEEIVNTIQKCSCCIKIKILCKSWNVNMNSIDLVETLLMLKTLKCSKSLISQMSNQTAAHKYANNHKRELSCMIGNT